MPTDDQDAGYSTPRDAGGWREVWESDREPGLESHRRFFGPLLVGLKRLLRPLVKSPQADLWERQRQFNLFVIRRLGEIGEHAERIDAARRELHRDLLEVRDDLLKDVKQHARRLAHLEGFKRDGLEDVMRHTDALFARVDQKFDRYRRESRELQARLGALLAAAEEGGSPSLVRSSEEQDYVGLERRLRGDESDISRRLEVYLPYLGSEGRVLDLGCGRGEALALLARHGLDASGVDSSAEMVRRCVEQGLAATEGDLFETLAAQEAGSLRGVVSFHVIEHLPAESLNRLVHLAWRALEPGGVLVLETPSPLSLVVSARNFWLDPTHRRPVHPEMLELLCEQAGFDPVERLLLRPFPDDRRLPEVDVAALPEALRDLGHRVNALRDELDELLYGHQDFAVVATRPAAGGG